jgi:hypothetical protein
MPFQPAVKGKSFKKEMKNHISRKGAKIAKF